MIKTTLKFLGLKQQTYILIPQFYYRPSMPIDSLPKNTIRNYTSEEAKLTQFELIKILKPFATTKLISQTTEFYMQSEQRLTATNLFIAYKSSIKIKNFEYATQIYNQFKNKKGHITHDDLIKKCLLLLETIRPFATSKFPRFYRENNEPLSKTLFLELYLGHMVSTGISVNDFLKAEQVYNKANNKSFTTNPLPKGALPCK